MRRFCIITIVFLITLTSCGISCNQSTSTTSEEKENEPRVLTGGGQLIMPLKAGERVELEVESENTHSSIGNVILDPYDNVIAETSKKIDDSYLRDNTPLVGGSYYTKFRIICNQEYPWHYAFIAATDGDYKVKIIEYLYETPKISGESSDSSKWSYKATIYP